MKADRHFKYSLVFTTLAPMGWEECPPLQAADLLAYENFKEHERRTASRKRRKTLDGLLDDNSSFAGRSRAFDKKGVAALRQYLTQEIIEQILLEANIRSKASV